MFRRWRDQVTVGSATKLLWTTFVFTPVLPRRLDRKRRDQVTVARAWVIGALPGCRTGGSLTASPAIGGIRSECERDQVTVDGYSLFNGLLDSGYANAEARFRAAIGGGLLESVNPRSSAEIRAVG